MPKWKFSGITMNYSVQNLGFSFRKKLIFMFLSWKVNKKDNISANNMIFKWTFKDNASSLTGQPSCVSILFFSVFPIHKENVETFKSFTSSYTFSTLTPIVSKRDISFFFRRSKGIAFLDAKHVSCNHVMFKPSITMQNDIV